MSLVIIDYLEAYTQLCQKRNTFVIESLQKQLSDAIDTGATPDHFKINGNSVELRTNRITDEYLDILFESLRERQFLRKIELAFNKITDKGAELLSKWLMETKSLVLLNLSSNDIGPNGGKLLAEALHINESLEELNLSNNEIGDVGGMQFASMLQINTTLKTLNLSRTGLSHTSLIGLSTALQSNICLKSLDISNNKHLSYTFTSSLLFSVHEHISLMIKRNQGLEELNLSQMGINDWIVIQWMGCAIGSNERLQKIDLSGNKIMRDGAYELAKWLAGHRGLKVLNLTGNQIHDEGCQAIAVALKHNKQLENLYLGNNSITDASIILLADVLLYHNNTLRVITLYGNTFQEPACRAFSQLLVKHPADKCRISPNHTDVSFYTVQGKILVAKNQVFSDGKLREIDV